MRRIAPALAPAIAALASVTALAAPASASAEPVTRYGPWTVSTAAGTGAFVVDATCVFGPEIVGEPPQLYVTGTASAPGALSTTVRCHAYGTYSATLPGSAAAFSQRTLWDSRTSLCVSAEATFATGTVAAPLTCVNP